VIHETRPNDDGFRTCNQKASCQADDQVRIGALIPFNNARAATNRPCAIFWLQIGRQHHRNIIAAGIPAFGAVPSIVPDANDGEERAIEKFLPLGQHLAEGWKFPFIFHKFI